jgi:hypothetical protein
MADQSIPAADNGTVACTASAKDLTRISLAGDQFASVSKISTGNPAEDFKIVNEPVRGDIYISVPDGFTKPNLSFFGTTRKGFVYKFLCQVRGNDAEQVFVTIQRSRPRLRATGKCAPRPRIPQCASRRRCTAAKPSKASRSGKACSSRSRSASSRSSRSANTAARTSRA